MGDQPLGLRHQRSLRDHTRAHADLDPLDERPVLGTDLVVELEIVGDPLLVGAGQEEVVEIAVGSLCSERHHRPDREVPTARHHVDRRAREQKVELAPIDLTRLRRRRRRRRFSAGRTGSKRSDAPRGSRRPGRRRWPSRSSGGRRRSGSTRGSSRRRPSSSPVLTLRPLVEDECVDVDTALGDEPREVAEVVGKRAAGRVRVDEDEGPPGVDRDPNEAEALLVEARLGVRSRRAAQRPVEVVGPRVVGALQRLAPAGALAEEVPAVTADVDERAEVTVAAPDEDDRDVAGLRRDKRPGATGRPCVPRTATCAGRCAPARAGRPPGRRTSPRGSFGCLSRLPSADASRSGRHDSRSDDGASERPTGGRPHVVPLGGVPVTMIRLHDYAASANCFKVRMLLVAARAPVRAGQVDIFAGESQTDAYLARNPAGRTPLLETDDGSAIPESGAILLYLAEGTPLLPDDRGRASPRPRVDVLRAEPARAERRHGAFLAPHRTRHRTARSVRAPPGSRCGGARRARARSHRAAVPRRWTYSVADCALFAYTRVAHEAGYEIDRRIRRSRVARRVAATPGLDRRPRAVSGRGTCRGRRPVGTRPPVALTGAQRRPFGSPYAVRSSASSSKAATNRLQSSNE